MLVVATQVPGTQPVETVRGSNPGVTISRKHDLPCLFVLELRKRGDLAWIRHRDAGKAASRTYPHAAFTVLEQTEHRIARQTIAPRNVLRPLGGAPRGTPDAE